MNKLFSLYNDTFGFTVFLYIGSDLSILRKAVIKEKFWDLADFDASTDSFSDEYAGCTTSLKASNGSMLYFVHIPQWEGTEDDIESLSHEMGHVTHRALTHRGWTDFVHEDVFHSYLYLHGSLFRKFLEQVLSEKKSKKSKKK